MRNMTSEKYRTDITICGQPSVLKEKLQLALWKHLQLMELGKKNQGCDRHLLGLKIAARHLDLAEPEFMKDPAFEKR